jgi:CubicO group peptidase (beta-lactamase class C family)
MAITMRSGMRRRAFLGGAAAAAWLPLAPAIVRAAPAPPADAIEQIRGFVELARAHWRIPGVAVAVIHGGEPLMAEGFGVKNLTSGAPVGPHTAFAIGSCSKAFTAAAAALLVEAGKIGWDDPVRRGLPDLALYDEAVTEQVTLRDLLSHRVGLGRAWLGEYGSDLSRAAVLARAADAPKAAEFREKCCYSNLGFAIAAAAVGRLAGEPFERFVGRRLLAPLAMADSTAMPAAWHVLGDVADPHEEWDYRTIPVPPIDHDDIMGAGSLYVSAHDMLAWLKLQLGGSNLVSAASLREMHTPQIAQPQSYGLGWAIGSDAGRSFIAHYGGTRGFVSRIRIEPDIGFACFVACNGDDASPGAIAGFVNQVVNRRPRTDLIAAADVAAARDLATRANRLLADKKADPLDPVTAPPLSAFAARYRNRGFGTLTLEVDGDALRFAIADGPAYDGWLVRYGATGFAYQQAGFGGRATPRPLRDGDARVHFQVAKRQVVGLDWLDMWFGASSFERA